MTAYEKVMAARDANKLTSVDYIAHMFGDSFIELHGDRRYADDKAVVAGLAMLFDIPVTVIGIEKGRNTKERVERNFGQAHPEGYRKALRLMKQAEKFRRPVLCLVDTSGAYPNRCRGKRSGTGYCRKPHGNDDSQNSRTYRSYR